MSKVIDKFDGEYAFLSNFYDCPVEYGGLKYQNSEAAFHAHKTLNKEKRKEFTTLNPSESKKLGRKLKLRDDWELVKNNIMYGVCLAKFTQNEDLKKKLLATDSIPLIEGTYWHDNTWGNCYCDKCKDIEGENRLGKILMQIRQEIRWSLYIEYLKNWAEYHSSPIYCGSAPACYDEWLDNEFTEEYLND